MDITTIIRKDSPSMTFVLRGNETEVYYKVAFEGHLTDYEVDAIIDASIAEELELFEILEPFNLWDNIRYYIKRLLG